MLRALVAVPRVLKATSTAAALPPVGVVVAVAAAAVPVVVDAL
jgi:hypothetical protein